MWNSKSKVQNVISNEIKKQYTKWSKWKFLSILSLFLKESPSLKVSEVNVRRFFFYLGFLSRIFTIRRTAGERGGYFFKSSLPLSPGPHIDISQVITAESSPLHVASSWNREPLVSERQSLSTKPRAPC